MEEVNKLEQIKNDLKENPIDPYKVLGIQIENLFHALSEDDRNNMIISSYISKLQSYQKKIRDILDNREKKPADRLEEIEEMMPEIFKVLFSFSRIKDEESRSSYADAGEFSINVELENFAKGLKQTLRIFDGNQKLVSAHRILGKSTDIEEQEKKAIRKPLDDENKKKKITEQETEEQINEKVNKEVQKKIDDKVQKTIIQHLGEHTIPKGLYNDTETLDKMIFKVFKEMWMYSKLKNAESRELYDAEYEFLQVALESESEKKSRGTVEPVPHEQPTKIILETKDDGTPKITLSNIGELQEGIQKADGTMLCHEKVQAYAITTHTEDKPEKFIFYSRIHMNRLASDINYKDAIMGMLLDPNRRLFSRRHLGRYVGEINNFETLQVDFDNITAAICMKYDEERKERRAKLANTQGDEEIASPEEPAGEEH